MLLLWHEIAQAEVRTDDAPVPDEGYTLLVFGPDDLGKRLQKRSLPLEDVFGGFMDPEPTSAVHLGKLDLTA